MTHTIGGILFAVSLSLSMAGLASGAEPCTSAWTNDPSFALPMINVDFGVVLTSDGKVILLGGALIGLGPLSEINLLDETSGTWSNTADLPYGISAMATAADCYGRVWIFGGWDGAAITSNVWIFDPNHSSITPGAPLPSERALAKAVRLPDGDFLVVGGIDVSSQEMNTVYRYDYASGIWSEEPPMNVGRGTFGIAVGLRGEVIAVGGAPSGAGTAEVRDHTTGLWRFVATPLVHPWQIGAVTQDARGRAWVAGGWNPHYPIAEVEFYDFDTDTWTICTPLNVARNGLGLVQGASGRLYAIGGGWAGGQTDVVEYLDKPDGLCREVRATIYNDTNSDEYGFSISCAENRIAVGAPFDDQVASNAGAVYVYCRIVDGWIEQAKLTPSDPVPDGIFGWSVSMSSNTIAVGSPGVRHGLNGAGFVYVFVWDGEQWIEQAKLQSTRQQPGDGFGHSVGLSQNKMVVSAVAADGWQGAAYVFERIDDTWSETGWLTGSDGGREGWDLFGMSSAISGESIVIGAMNDSTVAPQNGAAYVFIKQGNSWVLQKKLVASDAGVDDRFGASVSIDGNSIVAGAFGGPNVDDGSAYVFVRDPASNTWTQQSKLRPVPTANNDLFGVSVSISGDFAVVGAPGEFVSDSSNRRSAFVFQRTGSSWTQTEQLTPSDARFADAFGVSVSICGKTIAVGATPMLVINDPSYPGIGIGTNSGGVYVRDCSVIHPPVAVVDVLPPPPVNEGTVVTIVSTSYDPNGNPLTYHWEQIGGPVVSLDMSDVQRPRFVAPLVPPGGATLTFQLVVTAGCLDSQPATVNIPVKNVNHCPVADAGLDFSAPEGQWTTLHGEGSYDPDDDLLGIHWEQVLEDGDPGAVLQGADTFTPSFIAPDVGPDGRDLTFQITVTDHCPVDGLEECGCFSFDTVTVHVTYINQCPIITLQGLDGPVDEGTVVHLSAADSTDPDGNQLQCQWTSESDIILDYPAASEVTFTAPQVACGGRVLRFSVTVSDAYGCSETAEVLVQVENVNKVPLVDAPQVGPVFENDVVELIAMTSDPDGEPVSCKWVQVSGEPLVALMVDPTDPCKVSFTAPAVDAAGDPTATLELVFQVTVADSCSGTARDTVTVTVHNEWHCPLADAGRNQTVDEAATVTLNGIAFDPDCDPVIGIWTQTGGTAVDLVPIDEFSVRFTAPFVNADGALLEFRFSVEDIFGCSNSDTVSVSVMNINDPPTCTGAKPDVAVLWPPNHKMIAVKILGVADPNQNTSIVIIGITQDEPVNGLGDGDTAPDAVIQGDTVLLRSERSGNGNGRVYDITFVASDFEGSCTGSVKVVVPKSKKTDPCIDDGQRYDSTRP